MILPRRVDFFVLFFIEVTRHVVGDATYCPRSLYDCDSLEAGMQSSLDVVFTPDFMSSANHDTYIGEICRFFKNPSCSEPIISECKGELVYATKAFKNRQQYICENRFTRKGMRNLNTCVRQYHRYFSNCQEKRLQKLEGATYVTSPSSSAHPWCNLTNDYIICVYSIMAFGCNFEVANKYMETVNQSAPVVEAIYGYGCSFGHPMDILSTTSSPPETTGYSGGRPVGGYNSGGHRSRGTRRGSTAGLRVGGVTAFGLSGWAWLVLLFCSHWMISSSLSNANPLRSVRASLIPCPQQR
ncbi:uncharacterized protein LOC101859162 [Aplysia californica]|uniref:Uncharacterized protein LOC101859162 n=1 Tax=Aplysia californica TaxID=6500 RepID=A0ABM1VRB7_APLCA|nr:uncharacterized protein LOC101859162 [Aplysia californica]